MSEPMTPEILAGIRERGPVGYHCDHSDEPYDARTHHAWEYVEDEGFVFQHLPDVVSANWGPRDHLSPERRKQRCPRALPVYDADVPALLEEVEGRLTVEDVDRFLRRERDEYEPRGECWNTVNDVLDALRLHVVTGTPLTEPRPQGGPEAFGVGKEPLTEAEELRAEVERLRLKVGEYENTLNSFTTCTECAGHLDREHAAEWRASQAEAERDRLRAELARRDRVAAEPMDDALRLHASCVECMDRPVVPGSDFCPDCKELIAAESSSPSEEQER